MALHFSMIRIDQFPQAVELVVDRPAVPSGRELQQWLTKRFGRLAFFVEGTGLADARAEQLGNGMTVLAARGGAPPPQPGTGTSAPLLSLVVHEGPDAGQVVALKRGRYGIGRGPCRIRLRDALVSRNHAELVVSDAGVSLCDLGSANGTFVDGARISDRMVTTASLIRVGACLLRLHTADAAMSSAVPPEIEEPLVIDAPTPADPTRAALIGGLLPLAAGILLALATGMWFFLLFSILSLAGAAAPLGLARRRRRAFVRACGAAVASDERRRRQAAPDPGMLALRAVQAEEGPEPAVAVHSPAAPWHLRLGRADQPANVRPAVRLEGWRAPVLPAAPLLLRAGSGTALQVSGSGMLWNQLWHCLCHQLAVGAADRGLRLWFCGGPDGPALSLRFLPCVEVFAVPARLQEAMAAEAEPARVLLVIDGTAPGWADPAAACLRNGCRQLGGLTVGSSARGAHPDTVRIAVTEVCVLRRAGTETEFLPDGLSARTLDGLLRRAARRSGPAVLPAAGIPPRYLFEPPSTLFSQGAAAPVCTVGASCDGPLVFDLVRDGPHLLVAGTTGSGKSELLRTLILALAANCSPEDLNFLLVDFKGGSGLAKAGTLPHCVGLLTDLSAEAVLRALTALRSELRRREILFAAAGASDFPAYRALTRCGPAPPLARLVVVIDEFRMLADELPHATAELLRIAALGRSLGLHLFLATQRPQGAVTADIRANINSSVALRVQSENDSYDVIRSGLAAAIPAAAPGRAYLVSGGAPPVLFQAATVGGPYRPPAGRDNPLLTAAEYFAKDAVPTGRAGDVRGPPPAVPEPAVEEPAAEEPAVEDPTVEDVLCREILDACRQRSLRALHRPLLPPLPARLTELPAEFRVSGRGSACGTGSLAAGSLGPDSLGPASLDPASLDPAILDLGILDLPAEQLQQPLTWSPEADSSLAFTGGTRGGAAEVLGALCKRLLGSSAERHLYILDGDGTLGAAASAGRTGAYVTADDIPRAARVLRRLAGEVTGRLAAGTRAPQLVLLVSGWDRWAGAFRANRDPGAEELLQDLVRDGSRSGTAVAVTGGRELAAARFFALIPNRAYLPAGLSAEAMMLLPPLPPLAQVPGRGFFQGSAAPRGGVVQFLLDPNPGGALAASATNSGAGEPGGHLYPEPVVRPFRIENLPRLLPYHDFVQQHRDLVPQHARRIGPATQRDPLSFTAGVGGDELAPVTFTVPELLLVLGPAGSGRTNLLKFLAATADPGLRLLTPAPELDPSVYWEKAAAAALGSRDVPGQQSRTQGAANPRRRPAVALVDDADLLGAACQSALGRLAANGVRLVLTAAPSPLLAARVPLSLQARASAANILLGAQHQADADFLGIRLDPEFRALPGRGLLVRGPLTVGFQVPLLDGDTLPGRLRTA